MLADVTMPIHLYSINVRLSSSKILFDHAFSVQHRSVSNEIKAFEVRMVVLPVSPLYESGSRGWVWPSISINIDK